MSIYSDQVSALQRRLQGLESGVASLTPLAQKKQMRARPVAQDTRQDILDEIAAWDKEQADGNASQTQAASDLAIKQKELAGVKGELSALESKGDPLAAGVKEAMERKSPEYKAYAPSPEMLAMRNKFLESRRGEASQAANQAQQQGAEAIARKFASMGASGSGAQLSAMERNLAASEDIRRKGMADVTGQEMQIAESDTARGFQAEMANRDMQFKQQLANIDQANKLKGMDMAERQFEMDRLTTEFNKQMAEADLAASRQSVADRRRSAQGGAVGSLVGGLVGSSFGPMGAMVGSSIGGGLGGSFICTEFHRQGIIDENMWKLAGQFGIVYRQSNPEAFDGYQIFALPIVNKMKKSKFFTKIVTAVFKPWCQYLAHEQDSSYKFSVQGYVIFKTMQLTMPIIYKINKISKEQSWLTH